MPKKIEPHDEQIRALVAEAIGLNIDEDAQDAAASLVDEVMAKLKPVIGAAAERRRNEGMLRDAFREGFRTGQQLGRYARWHTLLWRHSGFAKRLRETQTDASLAQQSRYASFNHDY